MEKQKGYLDIFSDYPDVVTIGDLQRMLKISRHTAYSLIHSGVIPSRQIGRIFRIRKIDIISYIS